MFQKKQVQKLEKDLEFLELAFKELKEDYRQDIERLKRQLVKLKNHRELSDSEILEGYNFSEIKAEDLPNRLLNDDKAVLVDVRTEAERQKIRINNSFHCDINEMEDRLKEFESMRDKNIYFICASGGRSAVAADLLGEKGYFTTNVKGGMSMYPNDAIV